MNSTRTVAAYRAQCVQLVDVTETVASQQAQAPVSEQTITRQQLAAYRAHRTRLLRSLNNATGAVRKAIRAQVAGYDALLLDFAQTA